MLDYTLTETARRLLNTRYLLPGESWEDLAARAAKHAAPGDDSLDRIKASLYWEEIVRQRFIPSRMPYMGTERPFCSSCFVLGPIEDSRDSIFSVLRDMAEVQAFGGGCIDGDSVVITSNGPMPMSDLVKQQNPEIQVLSYNEQTKKMGLSTIGEWHIVDTPPGRVYRITFAHSNGAPSSSIEVSDWHPFFVFDGEGVVQVRADELEHGMAIIGSSASERGYNDRGWLLGYLAGDGCISKNGNGYVRVRVKDDSESAISRAASIMGVAYRPAVDDRYKVNMWEFGAYGEKAEDIKSAFGGFMTAKTKHVPGELWTAAPEAKFSFIVGHLDSDGWYNKEKKRFEAATISDDLAHGLVALAGSLGIRTRTRLRKSRKDNESPIWEIIYLKSQAMFSAVMDTSATYSGLQESHHTRGAVDLSKSWREKLRAIGVKIGRAEYRGPVNINGRTTSIANWLQRGKATRDTASIIAEACGDIELAQSILSSQIVYSVDQLDDGKVLYDLTVPGNQTYLAAPSGSGDFVVVHNTGYNFSHVRPEGNIISTTRGNASGPISFMQLYNSVTKCITRNGNKGGAQMGILDVSHPDIEKFITMKDAETDMVNFNISVGISDDFMKAVKGDKEWALHFGGIVYRKISARNLYHRIARHAWNNGEPGVIFLDTINRYNNFPEPIEATNACSEQPMPGYTSCNLGSINLVSALDESPDGSYSINLRRLRKSIRTGVWFLNDSINHAWWPIDKLRDNTLKYRNIGLGVMGLADMLIALGIPYDSDYAIEFSEWLAATFESMANEAAGSYAEQHGTRLNTTLTSIAPTGSIATLANVSPSIEPLFGLAYIKNSVLGQFVETNSMFESVMKKRGLYSDELMHRVARSGTVSSMTDIAGDIRDLFRLGQEIPWRRHVDMQAVWQRHMDSAVSKTINAPNSATIEDVENAFMHAWESGCKSTTLYRDGSRNVQVVSIGTEKKVPDLSEVGLKMHVDSQDIFGERCTTGTCSL